MSEWVHQFAEGAKRQFRKLDRPTQAAVLDALDQLVFELSNPLEPKVSNLKKLGGRGSEWRLRVGNYRVVFEQRGEFLLILVLAVANRRDVY